MQTKILHIANYYIGAKVYKNLVLALDQIGVEQTIYTAFAGQHLVGANQPKLEVPASKIIYRPILNTYTRLNYGHKTKKITADILKYISDEKFNVLHAHTLFSDGRVAYNLYKRYGTPYIVAIRNTDLNFFFRYFLHLRSQARNTLLSAKKIIFISEAYRKRLLAHPYFSNYRDELAAKSIVLPNGIDPYWLNNAVILSHQKLQAPARLLYVGKISRGKNLLRLITVVIRLNSSGIKCVLHIAGSGSGKYYQAVASLIKKHRELLVYHGAITDKASLLSLYRESDLFVMPSRKETFGLVYVEALSQGIPVIYTKNEGIDGFFPPETGESVNCDDEDDISFKIRKILENYSIYCFEPQKITCAFNWTSIAEKYSAIYNSVSLNIFPHIQSNDTTIR
ncbi:glycosyltransferase family 4 protein [Agriterribacter humi]|uniref:glycosyltransferase family 4 protein n=1 Tax=Agriterribacter humi TaxID=1104781 RepID=UPI001264DA13|nr:glycosyltransferase family 4 protein [Agriterribacter humi]